MCYTTVTRIQPTYLASWETLGPELEFEIKLRAVTDTSAGCLSSSARAHHHVTDRSLPL